jgi:predicted DNA-binding protein (UPF0251 family)
MDFETLILSELKKMNMPVKEAYERIGVSKQTFYNKIKASKVDPEFLTKVKTFISIDMEGPEIFKPNGTVVSNKSIKNPKEGLIPFYNADFMAGKSDVFYEDGAEHPDYYMDVPEFYGCIAFRAFGDSMEPIIKSSSILFGSKLDDDWRDSLEYGQIYGITMLNGRRYLKYVRKATDYKHRFLLKSANKEYDDFEIFKNKIKNLWLIQGWIDKRA